MHIGYFKLAIFRLIPYCILALSNTILLSAIAFKHGGTAMLKINGNKVQAKASRTFNCLFRFVPNSRR